MMMVCMKISLEWQALDQVIMDAHYFNFPIFLALLVPFGFLWVHYSRMLHHSLVISWLLSKCPSNLIPSVKSSSPTWPVLLPGFSLSLYSYLTAHCTGKEESLQLEGLPSGLPYVIP